MLSTVENDWQNSFWANRRLIEESRGFCQRYTFSGACKSGVVMTISYLALLYAGGRQ